MHIFEHEEVEVPKAASQLSPATGLRCGLGTGCGEALCLKMRQGRTRPAREPLAHQTAQQPGLAGAGGTMHDQR